jgi:bifunctional enzyme CysN/CysC
MAHGPDSIDTDIEAYLRAHERKGLLRFITCGSVDDGKSTLIGRLLYESKMIFEDQLAALEADSKQVGTRGDEIDFALLVDGLSAEREQGITIDVAYRYFSTDKRKFIVADTPGHEQYTRKSRPRQNSRSRPTSDMGHQNCRPRQPNLTHCTNLCTPRRG